MTDSQPFIQTLSSEWRQVVDYYNGLGTKELQDSFLRTLTDEQREYLLPYLNITNDQSNVTTLNEQVNLYPIAQYQQTRGLDTGKSMFSESERNQIIPVNQEKNRSLLTIRNLVSNKLRQIIPFVSLRFYTTNPKVMSRKKSDRLESAGIATLVMVSSVFGLISFIATGLIFNYSNTVFFIKQLPVFGSVLGAESVASKDVYYQRFEEWTAKNNTSVSHDGDEDKDGLTNVDEFIWGSDVFNADQNKNGIIDGQELLSGFNPTTGSQIDYNDSDNHKKISLLSHPMDIHNRLFNYSWTTNIDVLAKKQMVPSLSGSNYVITNPLDEQDKETAGINIDVNRPMSLTIEKVNLMNVTIALQDSDQDLLSILTSSNTTHLAGSVLPGQKGNSMLVLPNNNNSSLLTAAARELYSLEPKNKMIISATTTDGVPIRMEFEIIKNNLYDLDSITYPTQLSEAQLTISTSHPDHSHEKRIFITGKLKSIEKTPSEETTQPQIQ